MKAFILVLLLVSVNLTASEKAPNHSIPKETFPGWKCKDGYVQKWSKCVKIKVPKHGKLLEDGKGWNCNEGYERYRGTCRKARSRNIK